jgi:hypothetical protein
MKNNELIINQINWFLLQKKKKIQKLEQMKAVSEISTSDFIRAIKSCQGAINALQLDLDSNLETKIMDDIRMYQLAKQKLEINLLDTEDKNNDMFYLLCGAIDTLMLLITSTLNPLSACPINKDILLSKTIIELEEDIKSEKNKEKLVDLKNNLKIIKDLWLKNQATMKEEKQ